MKVYLSYIDLTAEQITSVNFIDQATCLSVIMIVTSKR